MASLRTTLVLMAILAVGFGVLAHRARERKKGLDLIRRHGGTYQYDFEYGAMGEVKNPRSWAPRRLRSLVGDENLHDVTFVRIDGPRFSDDDLEFLARVFPRIQALGVDYTAITDRGLAAFHGNPEMLALFVKSPGITDAGIDRLDIRSMPKLSLIDVRGTRVTQQKVEELAKILEAREARLRRENPGQSVPAHMILEGQAPGRR